MENLHPDKSITLTLPADMEYALVARMALSGFGMLAGLDVDLIEDLRTITDECFDCLMHQMISLKQFTVSAEIRDQKLHCSFCGIRSGEAASGQAPDAEITRCILETLVPYVQLHCDENGVCCIEFSMAV